MMFPSLFLAEWYKLRKTNIVPFLLIGPAVGLFMGLTVSFPAVMDVDINQWYISLFAMNLTYALLFLPLLTGVLASMICRYEHLAGGWKQLLSLPVTRGRVFMAKYSLLMSIVFVIQILYLAAIYTVGLIKGFSDPFPIEIVWKSVVGGWVATFPLVALQLWVAMVWKNMAIPLAINVIFTLPTILVANSPRIGPFYPWAQPFFMMYVDGEAQGVFFVPWDQVLTVVGGSFVLFYGAGLMYFMRKAV